MAHIDNTAEFVASEGRLLPAAAPAALSVSPDDGDSYPSKEQMAVWEAFGDILLWAGIRLAEDPNDLHYKLLDHLGFTANTSIREVGMIPAVDFNTEIAEWRPDGVRPPLAIRAKAKLAGQLARIAIGLEYSPVQERAWKEHQVPAHPGR